MRPSRIEICYLLDGETEEQVFWADWQDEDACVVVPASVQDGVPFRLQADMRMQGAQAHRVQVTLTPERALRVTQVAVFVPVEVEQYEKCLFNGYQSWTDTAEVPLDARQAGLSFAPGAVVDRYVLDGSGDYRFTDYPNLPGRLHGWTYCYFVGQRLLFAGGLSEADGFTKFDFNLGQRQLLVCPEVPNRMLDAGVCVRLANVLLVEGDVAGAAAAGGDAAKERALDQAFSAWFAALGMPAPRCRPLVGYSSWYRHYGDITEDALLEDLHGMQQAFTRMDTAGLTRVFQIDDGYAAVGDWLDLRADRFPRGLRALAAGIRAEGFLPGLWMAPFVCEQDSRLFAEHPDWLQRDEAGEPVRAGVHWSGSFALDTRNPQVRDYVARCIRTAVQDWGFGLLKLDFLYAACMIPRAGMNRGQLMADAVALLREAAGSETILDFCGVPLASAFGVADFCRIGCDVGLDWDANLVMRQTERERVSTRNSLTNTVYRAPLDGRAFGNDPDVVFLREDVDLTDGQRALQLDAASCCASMLLTSDNPAEWTNAQTQRFQQAIAQLQAKSGCVARAETAASQAVDQLLAYALRVQLLGEADATWARNGLLALVGLDAPAGDAGAPAAAGQAPVPACDDPDFYTHQLAEAARCLGVLPAGRAEEESFAAHAMNMLMPRPSEVAAVFGALQGTPDAACSYLYRVSCHSGYVHAHAAARDIKWTTHTAWGPLEITINRSKPEKDPRAIAAAAAKPAGDALGEAYPACQLCLSNEGYAGRAPGNAAGTHPARQNLRIAPITLGGQPWGLQFSPYSYYEQHCIVINREHTPMHVDRQAFENLLEFTDQFPQYFIGSNADLPLVGGSILTHDHYQAGLHTFPMERAGVASTFDVPGFSGVQGAVLRWPLSVLRLTGDNAQELARAASYVLDCWRAYSDVSVGVLAESEGVPHNTITPIARKTAGTAGAGDSYTLYLVLRCNVTSAKRPFGRFHPREELHHIKKENIGLIEVMGLAILPGRLAEELQVVEEALAEGDPAAVRAQLEANPAAAKHAPWAEELAASVIPSEAGPTAQQPVDLHLYVQDAVGAVFAAVLEDAGVFKWDPAGRAAQQRFLDTL